MVMDLTDSHVTVNTIDKTLETRHRHVTDIRVHLSKSDYVTYEGDVHDIKFYMCI